MVTRRQIRDQLIRLASEITKVPPEDIDDTATIDYELRMESVDFIELQVALEEEYQIEIDPVRVLQLNELSAIVDYIYDQVTGATGALPS